MINELLSIYNNSKLNKSNPECIFPETLIFNEGWLLRIILKKLLSQKYTSQFNFLQFPSRSNFFSEGQLYTPFKKMKKNDKYCEGNTHVDGIVGDFVINNTSKSGIKLSDKFQYLSVFEAKMFSPISKSTTHFKVYSQISRILSCMINLLKDEGDLKKKKICFVLFYPEENKYIKTQLSEISKKKFIESEINNRINHYFLNKNYALNNDFKKFLNNWERILHLIKIEFITWETMISIINNEDINNFYNLCKRFNKK